MCGGRRQLVQTPMPETESLMDQTTSGRQFVVLSSQEADSVGAMAPMGPWGEVMRDLFDCNTGPERENDDVLYGPGFRIELTPGQDPITQMLLTLTEEEIGWQVVTKLIKKFGWRLLDPATGRELNPTSD